MWDAHLRPSGNYRDDVAQTPSRRMTRSKIGRDGEGKVR